MGHSSGINVIGIAPSGGAVEELEKTGVFEQVMTTQSFAMVPQGYHNTILIVDDPGSRRC